MLPHDMIGQSFTILNRNLTMMIRRNPKLRFIFPAALINFFARVRSHLSDSFARVSPVLYHSTNANLFHCCVHKTGSQWIQSILSDLITYRYSGLTCYAYQSRMLNGYDSRIITQRSFDKPFPEKTIVSPLYIDYDNFDKIPKPKSSRAFFVLRDPREILISWYFSARYSHIPIGDIPAIRNDLSRLDLTDALLYSIDYLEQLGLFTAMRSWKDAERKDPKIMLLHYEDLVNSSMEVFSTLFKFLDVPIPDDSLSSLLEAYSFKRLSGRDRGVENSKSHIRKGSSGSWRKYFSKQIETRFYQTTGDLTEYLGY